MVPGVGQPLMSAIVVGVTLFRSTRWASGSVPVLTDQRSTPQVGLWTVRVIGLAKERDWASVTVASMDFEPVVVPTGATVENEKTLSPAVTSPCVPSS